VVRHAGQYVSFSSTRNEADGIAGNDGVLDGTAIEEWMKELGIHEDSAFLFVLMYNCQAAAQGIITKSEFVRCMNILGYSFPIPSLKSLS
jgi:hypothetical protein